MPHVGTGMARRRSTSLLVAVLAAGWLTLTAAPAAAACHIAGFVETDVSASAGTGVTSLIVELQGRVGTCAGTVDVTTVDGTAVAGEDYEAVSQTLMFEENDDRVETVDVTILPDAADGTSFTLELSNPTGDISGTSGPATVTIAGPQDDAADSTADDGTDEAAADGSGDAASTADDAAADDDGGGSLGIIIAVVAAVVIGGGAFVVLRGRG